MRLILRNDLSKREILMVTKLDDKKAFNTIVMCFRAILTKMSEQGS